MQGYADNVIHVCIRFFCYNNCPHKSRPLQESSQQISRGGKQYPVKCLNMKFLIYVITSITVCIFKHLVLVFFKNINFGQWWEERRVWQVAKKVWGERFKAWLVWNLRVLWQKRFLWNFSKRPRKMAGVDMGLSEKAGR